MAHAYSKLYIADARKNLGDYYDFAVNGNYCTLEDAVDLLEKSTIARQFGKGNPKYIAGRTGRELFLDAQFLLGLPEREEPYHRGLQKPPEYWFGWAVAYYQWLRNIPFKAIFEKIPPQDILNLYWPLHEADERKFIEALDMRMAKKE